MDKELTPIERAIKNKLTKKKSSGKESRVLLSLLEDNPYQPRMEYDEEKLKVLTETIKENGLLQPIVVTKKEDKYIIVAGHRRKRVFEKLKKEYIPAVFLDDVPDNELMVLAAVENLARVDLGIIEEAKSYYDMIQHGISVKELAKKLGTSESNISRKQNILNLSEEILEDIRKNKSTKDVTALSMLRKLENKEDQVRLYYLFLKNGRKWLAEEIKNCACAISQGEENKKTLFEKCVLVSPKKIKIELKYLSLEKQEEIKKIIKEFVGS